MRAHGRRIFSVMVAWLLLLALAMPGAAGLQEDYDAAVADAADARMSEVVHDLWSVTSDNPALIWEGAPGASRVLALIWTNYAGYRDALASGQPMTLTRAIWVTLAPQVRDYFADRHLPLPADRKLRLNQLLGLPPKYNARDMYFAELWVDPAFLFRPAAWPEIDDTTSGLEFPGQSADYQRFAASTQIYDKGTYWSFEAWFNDRTATIYSGDPFPWTRLGYTYDWGTSTPPHEGPSEFVVLQGATVDVRAVYSADSYLTEPSTVDGNDGGGGCTYSPHAPFGVELLLLAGTGACLFARRRVGRNRDGRAV